MHDLKGQHFGRLTALEPAGYNTSNGNILWLCQCSCGNKSVVDAYLLRSGRTQSCGCLRKERARKQISKNPAFLEQMGNYHNLVGANKRMKNSMHPGKKNKSGVVGVSFDDQQQVWVARLMLHHKYVLAKAFKKFEDAVAARKDAEKKYFNN
ncbi:hypothetical protein [Paucilactobacillus sp. N302-9]